VDWYEFADVSEVCTASIIRAMRIALMIPDYMALQLRREPSSHSPP
jgi:hypothetical protein